MATNCAPPNSLAAPGGMTEGLDVGVRGAAAPHASQHLSRALGLGVGVVGVAVAHDGVQVDNVVVNVRRAFGVVLLRGGCALALPLGWAVVKTRAAVAKRDAGPVGCRAFTPRCCGWKCIPTRSPKPSQHRNMVEVAAESAGTAEHQQPKPPRRRRVKNRKTPRRRRCCRLRGLRRPLRQPNRRAKWPAGTAPPRSPRHPSVQK